MNWERYTHIVAEMCTIVDLPDVEYVLETRMVNVEGFDVRLEYFEDDPGAMYVNFHFGIVSAGRTLIVYRLLLEANLLIYAQDQAQLGIDADTGGIVLLMRLPLTRDVTGESVVGLLSHYAEHGRYWRQNIIESGDEMFSGIASGEYFWLRV